MISTTIHQICEYLTRRGYRVDHDKAPVTATLAGSPVREIICLRMEEHEKIRIWISLRCPPKSDKLKLLETVNRLNMELTVSCTITLTEMDHVMIGACFPYAYEDTLFGLFFDIFLEDARHCLGVIAAALEDSDEDKAIIRL